MKKIITAAIIFSAFSPAWGTRTAGEKTELNTLLVVEAQRPQGTPEAGQSVWDKIQAAVSRIRIARDMVTRLENEKRADTELRRLEEIYQDLAYPALHRLSRTHIRTRFITTHSAIVFRERETYTWLRESAQRRGQTLNRTESAFQPSGSSMVMIQEQRESANEYAVKTEAFFAETRDRLQAQLREFDAPKTRTEKTVHAAVVSLDEAVADAADAAARMRGLVAPGGVYDRSVLATLAFGGPVGVGPFAPGGRETAVRAINAATADFVALEYHIATTIEEVRTLYYLLRKIAKLEENR